MRLSDMKENQECVISNISNSLKVKRRLRELGFVNGQRITCDNISFSGSPIAYTICGTKLAIRKNDANLIGVTL